MLDPSSFPVFLTAEQVSQRVVYSVPALYYLEKNGHFPSRIKISRARNAWSAEDIVDWMQSAINARPITAFNSYNPELSLSDRFISRREIAKRLLIAERTIYRMVEAGTFPSPFYIGPRRLAWLEREIIAWLHSKKPEATAA